MVCYVVQPDEATALLGVALLEDGIVALAPRLEDAGRNPDPGAKPYLAAAPDAARGAAAAAGAHALGNGALHAAAGARGDAPGDATGDSPEPDDAFDGGTLGWDAVLRALSLAASADHFSPLLNARGCGLRAACPWQRGIGRPDWCICHGASGGVWLLSRPVSPSCRG